MHNLAALLKGKDHEETAPQQVRVVRFGHKVAGAFLTVEKNRGSLLIEDIKRGSNQPSAETLLYQFGGGWVVSHC